MMNELNKEQKLVFVILTAVTALSILLAAGFAALYLSGRNTVSVGADLQQPDGADSVQEDVTGDAVTLDTAELAELRRENDYYKQQADTLRAELDALKNAAAEAETERLPQAPVDLESLFNPGDLTPADPESLDYTFDLNEQLAVIRALEQQMENGPYIVDPDGTKHKLKHK